MDSKQVNRIEPVIVLNANWGHLVQIFFRLFWLLTLDNHGGFMDFLSRKMNNAWMTTRKIFIPLLQV